jgi:hypothetical protein
MLQAKAKGKVCVHALPRATMALEPASLLREGSDAATCSRLRSPLLCLEGLQRCHVSKGSRPLLAVEEGSGAATHPSALDLASPLRRGPTLTSVLRLWTVPTSEVGSGADTCLMSLHMPWDIEIKEDIAAMVCSKALVFPRHAVRYRGACKTCGQTALS